MKPKPFSISVDQGSLDDLHRRLNQTRWPDEPPDAGWGMGTNLAFMRDLVSHWLKSYDWRAHERALNELQHFIADIKGEDLHFVHARANDPGAIPLLLLHGWPDSFFRFAKVIPKLAESANGRSFHVVAPSLPGFGFSAHRAMGPGETASLLLELMKGLGHERFVVAGGDLGSVVAMAMAGLAPNAVLGMHLTDVGYPDQSTDIASLTPEEQEFARVIQGWVMREGAYFMVQSTKPQSLAFAMNDSPVGLAAWMLSFMTSEHPEKTRERFTFDELITNACIYWFTQMAASSFRVYFENAKAMCANPQPFKRSTVPAAVLHPAWDAPLPRQWAERRTTLRQFSELESCGHFAAWEKPQAFVDDLRNFAATL